GSKQAIDDIFGPRFLVERPLLKAIKAGDRCVLLVDEIDRADDEFEAFLLEVLSDFQVTIPELGTIKCKRPPVVILTSNRTRELDFLGAARMDANVATATLGSVLKDRDDIEQARNNLSGVIG